MSKTKSEAYITHTVPPLTIPPLFKDEDGMWVVVLRGDRDKEQYRGPNFGTANAARKQLIAHYEERKKTDPVPA